jgi:hypothetical protein
MKRAPMRTGPRPPHRQDRDRDRGGTRAVARHPLEIPTSESKQDSNGSRIPYEYSLKTLLLQSYPQACKPTRFILKERDRDRDRDRGRDRTRRASMRTGPRLLQQRDRIHIINSNHTSKNGEAEHQRTSAHKSEFGMGHNCFF